MTSHCRSCGAPTRWVKTVAGKAMPLNADPDPAGNIILDDPGHPAVPIAQPLTEPRLSEARAAGATLWLSHFATCPEGRKWRRRR